MELGEKFDLSKILNKKNACLQVKIQIFQMAKGVQELHKLGFFHRDLKPGNFVIGKDNKIKLIDFGISKKLKRNPKPKCKEHINIWLQKYQKPKFMTIRLIFGLWDWFFMRSSQGEMIDDLIQIKQIQINEKLRANKIQNNGNKNYYNEKKLNKDVKRISIDEVIRQLEEVDELNKLDGNSGYASDDKSIHLQYLKQYNPNQFNLGEKTKNTIEQNNIQKCIQKAIQEKIVEYVQLKQGLKLSINQLGAKLNGELQYYELGEQKYDYQYKKIIFIGEKDVGKTILINSFVNYFFRITLDDNFRLIVANQEPTTKISHYYLGSYQRQYGINLIHTWYLRIQQ
ncbi:unnamed protein product (macronuclear) [Paramecium tetraurelia]|uniref:Protein kinase domain-containing protein n=1 Tax=Paramecium tetraurelia TaxID=5888 RepID=A0CUU8_PARTE|nr:uncharacterized protein GSPATT00039020001 [Paramecium tetraurelia]CAK74565.1 unnamed protein product [Paramecium tetraurelia]|eukprot:XP_001441962.1 hypothetical protein (macronuclear) [Paramecium tetraurelia strain d4-2]